MLDLIPEVVTPEELAAKLRCPTSAIIEELIAGRMNGFRVGGEWRLTIDEVLRFVGSEAPTTPQQSLAGSKAHVDWKQIDGFIYQWPNGGENFDVAWEADVASGNGRTLHIVIAFTNRTSAGSKRRRAVVFSGHLPRVHPLVEFVGANDFDVSKRLASVIKDRNSKHVRSIQHLPPEYSGMPTVMFSDVVVGPYSANSIAVLASSNDLTLMAQHALIRAKYKGLVD